jgi:hypothetical protein
MSGFLQADARQCPAQQAEQAGGIARANVVLFRNIFIGL